VLKHLLCPALLQRQAERAFPLPDLYAIVIFSSLAFYFWEILKFHLRHKQALSRSVHNEEAYDTVHIIHYVNA
jgi:hypothetical protein